MTLQEQILKVIDSPQEVEALYRKDPRGFARVFPEIFALHPDSLILKVWHERLYYQPLSDDEKLLPAARWSVRDIMRLIILSLISGSLVNLPHIFSIPDEGQFYSRYAGIIVITSLIAYFCIQKTCRTKLILTITTLVVASSVYLTTLPHNPQSQTMILSCIHMPIFMWSLLGVVFLNGRWRDLSGRMDYIRFNGELLIHTTIILIGGLLLTVLALSVFSISERIPEKSDGFGDMVNIGLVVMTLVIDIFALSAILFRLASYGFTPNRIAVLGANLLIFFHLSGITYHYVCCIRRGHLFAPLERWIVGYIPIYTIWSVIVTFGFPLLFDFQ